VIGPGRSRAGARWHAYPAKAGLVSLLAGLPALLSACAGGGDFGRSPPSVVNGDLLPVAGTFAAAGRGEPASAAMLTDDEVVLRDRAYRYLSPFFPEWTLPSILAELRRTRILPADALVVRPSSYYDALMSVGWRSSHAPYRRLFDDIAADTALLPPFFAVAAEVKRIDGIRMVGLGQMRIVGAAREEALVRVAENEELVHWVRVALAARIRAYRYALYRLLLAIPEEDGVAAERRLAALEEASR